MLSLQRDWIKSNLLNNMNIKARIKSLFSLNRDKIETTEAVQSIVSGTEFRGSSLWILVCAIVIASLGLNMNSTAVIIGAMLVSPLMGPIMGIGLGLATNDTSLIIRCLKNIAVATIISLIASCLYFWISPINDARSELLARTQPTIYDVLIAFFGGFAGIIATGTKQKGNILPGVAIATALMPPLCTAGYGLATIQFNFLFGAFYLFLINCVYIGIATWAGCLILKLPTTSNKKILSSTKDKIIATAILILVILPSAITTVGIIGDNVRNSHVQAFAHGEFDGLGKTQMVSYRYIETDSVPTVEVVLVGDVLTEREIEIKAARMQGYNLPDDCHLRVVQGAVGNQTDVQQFSKDLIQGMMYIYQDQILRLQSDNDSLKQIIGTLKQELGATEAKEEQ